MNEAVDPQILEQIKTILRRDLKLGQASLSDDMPLVGGEMDLDSLDILLLVSSIEKAFGIKIPSEAVGRWVFKDIGTLARYVQDNRATLAAPTPATPAPSLAPSPASTDPLSRLPHGPEFRFVSRIDSIDPGKTARGAWEVTGSETFFAGHFPGNPIVPGVLLVEAMAQLAGFATAKPDVRSGKIVQVDIRFERPIAPPATIVLNARVKEENGPLLTCEVSAGVSDSVAARGTIVLHLD